MNIFVAKLHHSITSSDLKAMFEEFGEVRLANIIMDKEKNRSKCFGFVEMDDEVKAKKAIAVLNESTIKGREIVVVESKPKIDSGYKGRQQDKASKPREHKDFVKRDRNY